MVIVAVVVVRHQGRLSKAQAAKSRIAPVKGCEDTKDNSPRVSQTLSLPVGSMAMIWHNIFLHRSCYFALQASCTRGAVVQT